MKKKISIAMVFVIIAAMALSITAHAVEAPQTVIDTAKGSTTVSITDITPREDQENDEGTENSRKAKDYAVGSYYPVSVQTSEDGGVRLFVKTFLVPQGTDPQALIEEDLTRQGIAYEPTDILRRVLPGSEEKKTVSQTVTMDSETDKLEDIIPLLKSTMDYQEDGFSGTLALDKDSIQTKAVGTSSYAYTLKDTREFTGLDRNDPYYIPKTTEKNGVTLSLANVDWTPMASGAENSEVPSLFRATALYTGTVWGSKADGYTVTASYTGEVSRTTEGEVLYSIVYAEVQPGGSTFPWKTFGLVALILGIAASAGASIFFLVRFCRKRKPSKKAPKDPYADRPKMHRPELLREMDRGLEEDGR